MRRWLQSPKESEVEGEPTIPVKPTQLVKTAIITPQKGKQLRHKSNYLQLIVLSSDDGTPDDSTANDTDPVIRNRRQISGGRRQITDLSSSPLKIENAQPTLVLKVTKSDYGKLVTICVNGEMSLGDIVNLGWKDSPTRGARLATGLFSSDKRRPGPWDEEAWARIVATAARALGPPTWRAGV